MSKIETLRLARNYIQFLSGILNDDTAGSSTTTSPINTANVLTRGMSQATTNVIYSLLGINHRSPLSFASPVRSSDEIVESNSGQYRSRLQNNSYQLNDLLASFQTAQDSFYLNENVVQADSEVAQLLTQQQQQQPVLDASHAGWITPDPWNNSSFDFDEPSIDF